MQQSDLFLQQQQQPVQVVVFPLKWRVGKIRRSASMLLSKQGCDADLYWKQVTAGNRKHLTRLGLTELEINAELYEFFQAVQFEMTRQKRRSGPDGGAA